MSNTTATAYSDLIELAKGMKTQVCQQGADEVNKVDLMPHIVKNLESKEVGSKILALQEDEENKARGEYRFSPCCDDPETDTFTSFYLPTTRTKNQPLADSGFTVRSHLQSRYLSRRYTRDQCQWIVTAFFESITSQSLFAYRSAQAVNSP